MRQTKYYNGYGYITTEGDGLFDTALDFVKTLVTSDEVKKIATEGATSLAKTAGTKVGEKLADKIIKPSTMKYPLDVMTKPVTLNNSIKKISSKPSKDLLKAIYGDGLFRGKGLRRI